MVTETWNDIAHIEAEQSITEVVHDSPHNVYPRPKEEHSPTVTVNFDLYNIDF